MDSKQEERAGKAGDSPDSNDAADLSRGVWADLSASISKGVEKIAHAVRDLPAVQVERENAWQMSGQLKDGIDKISMKARLTVSGDEFSKQNPGLSSNLSDKIGKNTFSVRHATTGEVDSGWTLNQVNHDGSVDLSKNYSLDVAHQEKNKGLIETLPGVPQDHTRALQSKLNELPPNVLKALEDKGYKIIATRTNSQAIPELAALTPRGWPKETTFDDSDGTHDNVRRLILAPLFTTDRQMVNRPDVLVHQIGHALDHSSGKLSNQPEFQEAFKKDLNAMKNSWLLSPHEKSIYDYFNQKEDLAKGERPGSEECFAALFGMILTGPENPGDEKTFQKYFPNTIKVVREQIKKL